MPMGIPLRRVIEEVGGGVGAAVGEFEDEVAFFIQIEGAAKHFALRGAGTNLAAEEPASFAYLCDGAAEIFFEALKFVVQTFKQTGGKRVAVDRL